MLAKLLAEVLLPPRFVGTRRKQSEKLEMWTNKAAKYTRVPPEERQWSFGRSRQARSNCQSAFATPISPVIVVIVPADLQLNKDLTVFARNLFCRETGTCTAPAVAIGRKAPPSAGRGGKTVIGPVVLRRASGAPLHRCEATIQEPTFFPHKMFFFFLSHFLSKN